ncbi:MAG: nucleotidyltransferase family protein [Intrasporangium sp.]|uniref:nucleotidyltransferase family protein n=1 Tax=Intrasporangium sp. TaxID=1925024 RepID=UPI003F813621
MTDETADLREALKTVAVALKRSGVPFALIGGYAAWARGGPEPNHDVDFLIAEEDAAEAAKFLAEEEGLNVVDPPEDWLFKVFTSGGMVDVIWRDSDRTAGRDLVQRATEMQVLSVDMPVMPATDLMVSKLNALDEHYCDLTMPVAVARALREQIDWEQVERDAAGNDFAAAVLFLLRRLGIIKGQAPEGTPGLRDGADAR